MLSRIQVFIRLPQCQPVVHPEVKVISKTEIVTWRVQKDLVTNSEIKRQRELFLPCRVFVLAPHKLHHHLESNLVPHYHHPDQVQLHALHPGGPIEQRTSKLQKNNLLQVILHNQKLPPLLCIIFIIVTFRILVVIPGNPALLQSLHSPWHIGIIWKCINII